MTTKTRTHDFYKVDDKTTTILPHYSLQINEIKILYNWRKKLGALVFDCNWRKKSKIGGIFFSLWTKVNSHTTNNQSFSYISG